MLTLGAGFGGGSWADEVEETYGMLLLLAEFLSLGASLICLQFLVSAYNIISNSDLP